MTEQMFMCGCGKTYTSYPAFSTHKKLKHNNNLPEGSLIPKNYQPKRGRPAFTLPQHHIQPNTSSMYSGLTIVELGLLRLQDKYSGILSEPEDEPNLNILQEYKRVVKQESQLIQAILKFNEIVITHMREDIAITVTIFLQSLARFLGEQVIVEKLEGTVFNQFFKNRELVVKLRQMERKCGLNLAFYMQLSVILSNYLLKIGLTTSAIRIRNEEN